MQILEEKTEVNDTPEKSPDKQEKKEIIIINEETIQNKIYVIRGQKVMLDFDLAEIYGYETKNFNRQVKNNYAKFEGEDFMFQLTDEETIILSRCKNFTLNRGSGRGKNVKYNPYAFSEQGIYMLMTVLRGDLAIKQSRALIRAFKQMKDYIIENQNLIGEREYLQLSMQVSDNYRKTLELRSDLSEVENQMAEVMDRLSNVVTRSELSEIMNEFGEPHIKRAYLVLNGEPFKADLVYDEIYRQARKSIYIVDNYIGIKTLELLSGCASEVEITIFSDNLAKGVSSNIYADFCKEHPCIQVKLHCSGGVFHDRYIILDYGTEYEKIFLCGASSKDAGARVTSILEDEDRGKYQPMLEKLLTNPPLVLK